MLPPSRLVLDIIKETDGSSRFLRTPETVAETVARIIDPDRGTEWGYVVVDNTRRGPGLGGIRMAKDLSLGEMRRLARVMTLKNGAAGLPYGGGKSGLKLDPRVFVERPELKRQWITLFAEALFPLETYISAPDMGTDEDDVQLIHEIYSKRLGRENHLRGGASRPPEKGGIPIDGWGLTAHGLFAAARTLENHLDGFRLAGARVVIQGFGNVGAPLAEKLFRAGARIVGCSDIHAALWDPDGLDLDELLAARATREGLASYCRPAPVKWLDERRDWLLEAPCDLLVPAARPDALTSKNADRIDCRAVLQGANSPSSKTTEYYLENRRGILCLSDFIVNAGGVIGCAVELRQTANPAFREELRRAGARAWVEELIDRTIAGNVRALLSRLEQNKKKDRIFREEAVALAEEKIASGALILH